MRIQRTSFFQTEREATAFVWLPGPISMVIVPTRELAQQVATAAKPLKNAAYGGIRTLALYGGGREGKDAQLGERFGAPHL